LKLYTLDMNVIAALLRGERQMMAGIALANEAVLVARNVKHFARIEGLEWNMGGRCLACASTSI
jgi:hypothetical protein